VQIAAALIRFRVLASRWLANAPIYPRGQERGPFFACEPDGRDEIRHNGEAVTEPSRLGGACLGILVSLVLGCSGPSVINLSYQCGTYVRKVSPVRVGVYYPEDERPGWPASAAMRMFDGTHGNDRGMLHTKSVKAMNVFVAESLRAELVATGMNVSALPEFNRRSAYATPEGGRSTGVDRVVFGRINYFGFVGPVPDSGISPGAFVGGVVAGGIVVGAVAGAVAGHAASERRSEGVTFGDEAPGGKAYVDIDLWVVDPSSEKVLWAGTARGKPNSGISSGAVADRVAIFLSDALRDAFRDALWQPDFFAAMGATVMPPRESNTGNPKSSQVRNNVGRLRP